MRKALGQMALITAAMLVLSCMAAGAGTTGSVERDADTSRVKIMITGPRALRDAVQILNAQLDATISYEDPRYENDKTCDELTPSGAKIPASRTLIFSYDPKSKPEDIVKRLVDEYARINPCATFNVLVDGESRGLIDVVPARYMNEKGELADHSSPLDLKVSISMKDSTFSEVLDEVMAEVNTGLEDTKTGIGRYPKQFFNERLSFECENRTARWCLSHVIEECNRDHEIELSWHLARGPFNGMAIISICAPMKVQKSGVTICVEHARPMLAAVRLLERDLGCPIVYEDPEYIDPAWLMAGRPRGGTFSFSHLSDEDPSKVLARFVNEYNEKRGPAKYRLRQANSVNYILPVVLVVEGGKDLRHTPVLETVIPLTAKDEAAGLVLKRLCENLTGECGKKIVPGELPKGLDLETSIAIDKVADDKGQPADPRKPAREWLALILDKMGASPSFEIISEPRKDSYVLIIHRDGQ